MKDWDQYAKTCQETAKTTGSKPSTLDYLMIKATDSSLAISVFLLTIFFASIGLFYFNPDQHDKTNWAFSLDFSSKSSADRRS